MLVKAVRPDDFESTEQTLLPIARESMPRLPFDRVDLLLIDQIGKNISGTGLDTNVVGRKSKRPPCGGPRMAKNNPDRRARY